MNLNDAQLLKRKVFNAVYAYCLSRGAKEGPGVNNFVPHDLVTAYAMASYLTLDRHFDAYLEIAPEGCIYGYFFSVLGIQPLQVHVDYPPTKCLLTDWEALQPAQSILLIEDDVIGGGTLRLVVEALQAYRPVELSLYLGHHKGCQHLQNIPDEISEYYLTDNTLDYAQYDQYEQNFYEFFAELFSS